MPYFVVFAGPPAAAQPTWGQFGDYIGGTINPVLAFFAFIALLFTIAFQSYELRVTNQELAKSVRAAKHQTFESTFFQLVRLYNSNVDAISTAGRGIDGYHRGRDALYFLAEELPGASKKAAAEAGRRGFTDAPDHNYSKGFQLLQEEKRVNMLPLFYTLHEIFSFLETETSDRKERRKYSQIVRTQLSTAELMLLSCFCISDIPKSLSMKAFVERYSLFELIAEDSRERIKKFAAFQQSAFDSSLNPAGE